MSLKDLLNTVVSSIVDDESAVEITEEESDKGLMFEVRVGPDDVGKIIGRKGRIANSIRTFMKAAGAKRSKRVMVNIFNKPAGSE